MTDPFKPYLHALQTSLVAKDAMEHTHRPALKALLESLQDVIRATNEPRADVTSCGKPDMRLSKGAALLTLEKAPETGTLKGWPASFGKTLLPHLTAQSLTICMPRPSPTATTAVGLRWLLLR